MNNSFLFATQTETEEDVLILTETEKQNNIVLFNDDVNTFEFVIETLVNYCKHDPVQAEQCAYIVHYKGKCSVKNGPYDELEPICTRLLELGLSAEIA